MQPTSDDPMPPLRVIGPGEVEVPELQRGFRVTSGLAAMVFGPLIGLGVANYSYEDASEWSLLAGQGIGAAFCLVGLGCVLWVNRVRINREAGTVTRSWGILVPLGRRVRSAVPTAVRLQLARDMEGINYNTVYLVHAGGEISLRMSSSLAKPRRLCEALAAYLDVEYYEDRLYRYLGALGPQRGPGLEPGRTYVIRKGEADDAEPDAVAHAAGHQA